jgi:hypothetical protein
MTGLAAVRPEGDAHVERVAGGRRSTARRVLHASHLRPHREERAAAEIELIVKLDAEPNDASACTDPRVPAHARRAQR